MGLGHNFKSLLYCPGGDDLRKAHQDINRVPSYVFYAQRSLYKALISLSWRPTEMMPRQMPAGTESLRVLRYYVRIVTPYKSRDIVLRHTLGKLDLRITELLLDLL